MKKKLISMAVAAAMAAPAAAMAEAILYGKLHVSIDYADVKNAAGLPTYSANGTKLTNGTDFSGWGINAYGGYMPGAKRAQRVGVKGSEDLGNGLKAIYQVEFGLAFGASDNNLPGGNNNSFNVRNSFVGLAGSFGSFFVGRHDTPLKISTGKLDMFADTMADYNGTVGFDDIRSDNAIAYVSPSFSGFQFMGALVAPGGATANSYDTVITQDGRAYYGTINPTSGRLNVNSDQLNAAYSLAGIYSNGPFYASLAYESLGNELFMDTPTSEAGSAACYTGTRVNPACGYVGDDYTKWRFGLGLLDWNGFTLSGVYEDQQDLPGGQIWEGATDGTRSLLGSYGPKKQKLWQIQAAYAFGNNQVKAMYGSADRDQDDFSRTDYNSISDLQDALDGDRSTWAIAFDHNFSKRTQAYVVYTSVDDDLENVVPGSEWSGFSMGMIHKF